MTSLGTHIIIAVCIGSVVVGMSGNLIIVVVRIFKQIQRRNTTTYTFLICQLAVADFLFAFTIIFDIHSLMHNNLWVFGLSMCKFMKTLQSTSVSTTVGFLTVMAYERYLGLSKPLHHRWSIKKTAIIVLVIWVYIFLTFVPFLLAMRVENGMCDEIGHPSETFRKAYTMFMFVTNFLIPLLCIIVFHTLIVSAMRKHTKSMQSQRHRSDYRHTGESENTYKSRGASVLSTNSEKLIYVNNERNCCTLLYKLLHQRNADRAISVSSIISKRSVNSGIFQRFRSRWSRNPEDHKLIKMLVAVTLCFAIMTTPTSVWYIWNDFGGGIQSQAAIRLLEVFASLVYMHCCANCIIYSVMDKKFRTDVIVTFKYLIACKRKRPRIWEERFKRTTLLTWRSRKLSITATKQTSITQSKCTNETLLNHNEEIFLERETVFM